MALSGLPHNSLLQLYSFNVSIGPLLIGFSKVSGLKSQLSFEQIPEGGLNDRVHSLYAPNREPQRITFEKGAYDIKFSVFEMPVGARIFVPVTIMIMDDNGNPGKILAVENPILESWEISDLSANHSEVLVNKLTFLHSGISVVAPSTLFKQFAKEANIF